MTDSASAAGCVRVALGEAGTVTLTLRVDLLTINAEDLEFVLDILRRFVSRGSAG